MVSKYSEIENENAIALIGVFNVLDCITLLIYISFGILEK